MINRETLEKLIRESVDKNKKGRKEYFLFGRILVSVKDDILPAIDMLNIVAQIEKNMPEHLFDEVDDIFIGSFSENDDRALEAHYADGAIYITSDLSKDYDYVENIVHECAHAVEKQRGLDIYGDGKLENEFLGKRKRLAARMHANNLSIDDIDFENPEYSEKFDLFLYKDIGYEKLSSFTKGLFNSPYAATCLGEYFANGFEEYFLGDKYYIAKIGPNLYKKLDEIIEGEKIYV